MDIRNLVWTLSTTKSYLPNLLFLQIPNSPQKKYGFIVRLMESSTIDMTHLPTPSIKHELYYCRILTSAFNVFDRLPNQNQLLLAIFTLRKHRNGDASSAVTSRLCVRFQQLKELRIQRMLRAELTAFDTAAVSVSAPGRIDIESTAQRTKSGQKQMPQIGADAPAARSAAAAEAAAAERALAAERDARSALALALAAERARVAALERELRLAQAALLKPPQSRAIGSESESEEHGGVPVRGSEDSAYSSVSTINPEHQHAELESNDAGAVINDDTSAKPAVAQLEQKLAAVHGTLEFMTTQYLQTTEENHQLRHKLSTGISSNSFAAPASPPPENSETAISVPHFITAETRCHDAKFLSYLIFDLSCWIPHSRTTCSSFFIFQ
ncbi:hypothetical protein BDR26DRAFT_43117 [Obelidium mucronatum]|nr:hypothetical protein BDR26DRAFT_43117 [Obelidium mucronatum]